MDLALYKKLSELALRDGVLRFAYIDENGRAWAVIARYQGGRAVSTLLHTIRRAK